MEERATGAAERSGQRLRITWVKSAIGYRQSQRLTIKSLGLRKLNQTVEHYDSPTIRGMVNKVHHLVRVEELAPGEGAAVEPRETGTQRFARRMEKKAAAREELLALLAEELDEPAATGAGRAATDPEIVPVVDVLETTFTPPPGQLDEAPAAPVAASDALEVAGQEGSAGEGGVLVFRPNQES